MSSLASQATSARALAKSSSHRSIRRLRSSTGTAMASAITIAASSHQTHAGTPWASPAVLSAATVVLGTEGWATAVVSDVVGDGVSPWLVVSSGVGVGSVGVEVGSVGLEVCVGPVGITAGGVVVTVGSDVGSAVRSWSSWAGSPSALSSVGSVTDGLRGRCRGR